MELIAAIIIIGCVDIFVLSILGIICLRRHRPTLKKQDKEEERQRDTIGYF